MRVHGDVEPERLAALPSGITHRRHRLRPDPRRARAQQGSNAWLTVSLSEGKNREIRRVLAHLGLQVTRLIRIAYGPFQLGELARGAVEEVPRKVLREQLGTEPRASRTRHADHRR